MRNWYADSESHFHPQQDKQASSQSAGPLCFFAAIELHTYIVEHNCLIHSEMENGKMCIGNFGVFP